MSTQQILLWLSAGESHPLSVVKVFSVLQALLHLKHQVQLALVGLDLTELPVLGVCQAPTVSDARAKKTAVSAGQGCRVTLTLHAPFEWEKGRWWSRTSDLAPS